MAGWGADQIGVRSQRSQALTNTVGAVISKHRLLHCVTEHSYSPVPWVLDYKDGGGGIRIFMFILIIMITTIPKHSKKDIYRLKSIL